MGVGVILSLLSKDSPLVINNKVDKERGTFELNVGIRSSIDWQKFKGVYNNIVKIDI